MNNFKYKFAEKVRQFMVGRYGPDELYQFSTFFVLAIIILNMFIKSQILSIFSFIIMAFNIFRPFSRNYQARYKENALFLKSRNAITGWYSTQKKRRLDKDHAYKKCPHCKKTLRLPNRKGKHTVNCPNCHQEFKVKI